MKKYNNLRIGIVIGIIAVVIISWSIYIAVEHTLDLQLHGSYTIDTSGIREYVGVKENAPFTYFLQITGRKGTKPGFSIKESNNYILKNYSIELPDDLLADIDSSENSWYVLLSIGRELKEVKYNFLKRYSDGITSKAIVTFCEEYQGDVVYAYLVNRDLFFFGESYYMMNGDERVFLGNQIKSINNAIPK